ncbi:MAG TPA: hypothetical protein VGE02_08115 [Gemmatimonadales bacterium]
MRHFLQRLANQPAVVWLAAARRYEDRRDDAAMRRADRALGEAVEAYARQRERDALVGPVLQLARRAVPAALDGDDDLATIERLAEPALAAALALLAEDLLAAEQVETLYSAFATVVPLAELPPAPLTTRDDSPDTDASA